MSVDKLSPDVGKLVQDTHDIIETARVMVQEKNADELFQQFMWHTREVDRETIENGVSTKDGVPVDSEKVNSDSQQGMSGRSVFFHHHPSQLVLTITSGDYRMP